MRLAVDWDHSEEERRCCDIRGTEMDVVGGRVVGYILYSSNASTAGSWAHESETIRIKLLRSINKYSGNKIRLAKQGRAQVVFYFPPQSPSLYATILKMWQKNCHDGY